MTRVLAEGTLPGVPDSIFYLPEFITALEEQALIAKVLQAPKPKWVQLKNRRLQNWGGIVTGQGMIAEPLPAWLSNLFPRFRETGVFNGLHRTMQDPNHCLVNEYLPGQGILPHKDGPAYLPTVATVSLSSHCLLDFYPSSSLDHHRDSAMVNTEGSSDLRQEPVFSIFVQPRSLLVLKAEAYSAYMHGIREVTADSLDKGNIVNIEHAIAAGTCANGLATRTLERSTRISLTFRIVEKTKAGNRFLRTFASP